MKTPMTTASTAAARRSRVTEMRCILGLGYLNENGVNDLRGERGTSLTSELSAPEKASSGETDGSGTVRLNDVRLMLLIDVTDAGGGLREFEECLLFDEHATLGSCSSQCPFAYFTGFLFSSGEEHSGSAWPFSCVSELLDFGCFSLHTIDGLPWCMVEIAALIDFPRRWRRAARKILI